MIPKLIQYPHDVGSQIPDSHFLRVLETLQVVKKKYRDQKELQKYVVQELKKAAQALQIPSLSSYHLEYKERQQKIILNLQKQRALKSGGSQPHRPPSHRTEHKPQHTPSMQQLPNPPFDKQTHPRVPPPSFTQSPFSPGPHGANPHAMHRMPSMPVPPMHPPMPFGGYPVRPPMPYRPVSSGCFLALFCFLVQVLSF